MCTSINYKALTITSLSLVISICYLSKTTQAKPWIFPNNQQAKLISEPNTLEASRNTREESGYDEQAIEDINSSLSLFDLTTTTVSTLPTTLQTTTIEPISSTSSVPSLCRGGSCDRFQRTILGKNIGEAKEFNTENFNDKKGKGDEEKGGNESVDFYELMFGFDHHDFVVSDLEFELVLRRLQKECEDCKLSVESQNQDDNNMIETNNSKMEINEQREIKSDEILIDYHTNCLEHLDEKTIESILIFCRHKLNRKCLDFWHKTVHETSVREEETATASVTSFHCPICNCRKNLSNSNNDLDGNNFKHYSK